jgi:uncharacterized protein (DUF1697 family)
MATDGNSARLHKQALCDWISVWQSEVVTRYVALLRGINVGGNKKIAMADLRKLMGDLGFDDVATLLQSGNAVFTAKHKPDHVVRALEDALDSELGMSVRCLVRTAPEMRAVVNGNPLADVATNNARLLVTFLSGPLDGTPPDPAEFAPEQFRIVGREIYMWFPEGIRDGKLARVNWDRKYKVVATGRNWNTVTKLTDMVEAG